MDFAPARTAATATCASAFHRGRARAILRELALEVPGPVLEIGCGHGAFALELAEAYPEAPITGIDSDPDALSAASKAAGDRIGFLQMDARKLGFADRAFELVCISRVLVHTSNPALVLAEAARVLRPGGRALVIEPAALIAGGVPSELVARILGERNPGVASQIPLLFEGVGLRIDRVVPHAAVDEGEEPEAQRREYLTGRGQLANSVARGACTSDDVTEFLRLRGCARVMHHGGFQCAMHLAFLATKR